MSPDGVVEHLDVIEDVLAGRITGCIDPAADALAFEQLEEALGYGVIVAIASPAHATHQIVRLQERLPVVAAELAALIGMHGDGVLRLAPLHGHQQGVEGQFPVHARLHGPVNDLP